MELGLGVRAVQLRAQLASAHSLTVERVEEAIRRVREAARDVRHRIKTGRPRGMPTSFVHPPLESSKGCSHAARRVHGLLYGYSLAYEEVRPRVETIAQALGYSKSTTYNATAELRHAGLLVVHERRGRDQRRIANRYEVRCVEASPPLKPRGQTSEVHQGATDAQKTGTGREKSEKPKREPRPDSVTREQPMPLHASALAKARRRRVAPVAEDAVAELIGLERFRALKAGFGGALDELRSAITEYGATDDPEALTVACDALIGKHGKVENPGGYFRGILRRQLGERDTIHTELAELMAEYQQARSFGDPSERELERRLNRDSGAGARARLQQGPTQPVVQRSREGRSRGIGRSPAVCQAGDPQRDTRMPMDKTLTKLKATHPRLAELLAREPQLVAQADEVAAVR